MCKENETAQVVLNGKLVVVDKCLATLLTKLNSFGVRTVASCCGHGDKKSFYIVITKSSYTSCDKPFYKATADITLRNRKVLLIPKGCKAIDGLFVVDKNAVVIKHRIKKRGKKK